MLPLLATTTYLPPLVATGYWLNNGLFSWTNNVDINVLGDVTPSPWSYAFLFTLNTKTCQLAHAAEQGPSTLSICLSLPHNKMWLFVMCTLTCTLLIRGASGAHVHCMPQTRHAKSLCSNFLRRSMNMMPSTATVRTPLSCANSHLWNTNE